MAAETDLFTFTSGPLNAPVAIVGESWGSSEASVRKPFVGESGAELTRMLADAGIARADCFLTNVVSEQPRSNDMRWFFHPTSEMKGRVSDYGLYPRDNVRRGVEILHSQLSRVRPRIIIALGNYALWALTRGNYKISNKAKDSAVPYGCKVPSGIVAWRGSYLYWNRGSDLRIPVIPTFHPAAIMRQWSWRSIAVHDIRFRAAPIAKGEEVPAFSPNFIIRPTLEQAIETLEFLINQPAGTWLATDVETSGGQLRCVGFAWSANDAICIPFMQKGGSYWSTDDELQIRSYIECLFGRRDLLWTNQNIPYDLQHFDQWLWCRPPAAHDTMVAQHVWLPGTPKDLSYISSLLRRHHVYWKDEGRDWDKHLDDDRGWNYNCVDCVAAWEITQTQRRILAEKNLMNLFHERMELLEVAYDMMRDGVNIDEAERRKQTSEVLVKIMEHEGLLNSMMPEAIPPLLVGKSGTAAWYDSPQQLRRFFYDLLGIKEILHGKTKQPTVNEDALLKIKSQEPILEDLIDAILHLRTLGVFYSNFLTARLEPDGRMRSSFNVAGPETFRWSSDKNAFGRGTNFQNIPAEVVED